MTVASEENQSGPYTGNGVTTVFDYEFRILNEAHIRVIRTENGIGEDLALGSDYTVSGVGNAGGGSITMASAPTASQVLTMLRDVPFTQETDLENQGAYYAETIEDALDLGVMRDQQMRELLSRAVIMPPPVAEGTVEEFVENIQAAGANAAIAVTARDQALAAAAALGNQLQQYDTRAMAAAAAIPVGVPAIRVTRRAVGRALGYATYVPGTMAGPDAFNDALGHAWQLDMTGPVADAAAFAAGDGATDDYAALQMAIDAISTLGGGRVRLSPGRSYRVVLTNSTPDYGLVVKPGVILDLNGGKLNLECMSSGVKGLRMQGKAHVIGYPGEVNVTVSDASHGGGTPYHCPIFVGAAYGDVTSVGSLGPYINASGWSIRGVTLNSVRTGVGGAMISIMGGCNQGLIEDITIPSNNTVSIGIALDHGTVGNISQDIAASRALYDAGQAYSVFPHDIVIRRIKIGNMNKTVVGDDGGMGVRISGCYKILVDGVDVAQASFRGFFHTGGDFGFEFAPSVERRMAYRGTVIRNFDVREMLSGIGFNVEAYGDNIYAAVGLGYSPIHSPIYNTDILLENCRTWTTSPNTADVGFATAFMIGGTLRNCFTFYHQYGLRVQAGTDQLRVEGCELTNSWKDGIYVGDAVIPPKNILITGTKSYKNGFDSSSTYAGIRLDGSVKAVVENCILGLLGEDTQSHGVNVTSSASAARIVRNTVLGHKAAGAGLQLAGANDYGCVDLVSDNQYDASVTTKVAGVNIVPFKEVTIPTGERVRHWASRVTTLTGSKTPPAGTWTRSDKIFYADPVAGDWEGSTCVATGTPGTWKRFGTTEA